MAPIFWPSLRASVSIRSAICLFVHKTTTHYRSAKEVFFVQSHSVLSPADDDDDDDERRTTGNGDSWGGFAPPDPPTTPFQKICPPGKFFEMIKTYPSRSRGGDRESFRENSSKKYYFANFSDAQDARGRRELRAVKISALNDAWWYQTHAQKNETSKNLIGLGNQFFAVFGRLLRS